MRSLFCILILIAALSGQLHATTLETAIVDVKISERAINVSFAGTLEAFPGARSFDVFRSPDLPSAEWNMLGQDLKAHIGKNVVIAISNRGFATRGSILSFFGVTKVQIQKVR